jgi:hypothetical protein
MPPGVSTVYGASNAANPNEIFNKGGFTPNAGMNDTFVYMGEDYKAPRPASSDLRRRAPKPPTPAEMGMMSVQQAQMEFDRFDPMQAKEWGELTRQYVGYKNVPSLERQRSMWNQMIGLAGAASSAWGRNVSPWEMLRSGVERSPARQQGQGRYTGPVTVTDTSRVVNLSNPSEARSFLDGALANYLGRAPSPKEYQTFTKALNAAQEAEPEITRSVTTTTPGRATQTRTSDVRREGGIVPGQYATEWAKSQEGVAETQAGTTLLNAFLEMF